MVAAPKHAWFSESTENLIVLRLQARPSNEEIIECTRVMEHFFTQTPATRGWVVDMTDVAESNAFQRKCLSDYEKRNAHLEKIYITRLAWVAPSPYLRGLVTAYLWLYRPPYPYRVLKERKAGERWVTGVAQVRDSERSARWSVP